MPLIRTLVRSLVVPLVVVAAAGCSSSSDDATTTTAKATTTTESAAPTTGAAASGEVDCTKLQAAISSVVALSTQAGQLAQSGEAQSVEEAQFQQVVAQAKEQVRVIDRQARAAGADPGALELYVAHNKQLVALLENLVATNDVPAFQQGVQSLDTAAFEQAQEQVGQALKDDCPTLTGG